MEENQSTPESQSESSESSPSSSGNKNGLIIVVVIIAVIVVAGGVYFLSKKSAGSLSNTSVAPSSQGVATSVGASNQPVQEITVSGTEFSFSTAKLTVNKGDRVKLVFKNTGKMQHDFVIDEFGVATKVISGGEEDTVEFTPTDTGSFKFYCSVGNHRAQGMEGTLEVK